MAPAFKIHLTLNPHSLKNWIFDPLKNIPNLWLMRWLHIDGIKLIIECAFYYYMTNENLRKSFLPTILSSNLKQAISRELNSISRPTLHGYFIH